MSKKTIRIPHEATPLTVNPFAALSTLVGEPVVGEAVVETQSPNEPIVQQATKSDSQTLFSGKVVVAKSRKGRGGRTVVLIHGLAGSAQAMIGFVRDLKRALGCGVVLEDDVVVVQGDQCERVRDHLVEKGARRVVIGTP